MSLARLFGSLQGRDVVLALFLLGLMFVTVLLSAQQDAGGDSPPPWTSHSTEADGTRALALWLEALGYPVRRAEGVSFGLGRKDRLLFVLGPQLVFSSGEVEMVDDWVKSGGTLIWATAKRWDPGPLLEHFGLEIGFFDERVEGAEPAQPLLLDPPWDQIEVRTERYLVTARDDAVVLAMAEGQPVLLSFEHGAGRVFVTTALYLFTNKGLSDADNARLIHNVVALVGDGAQVVFDEFHHGYQEARTLTTWLKVTAQGRSLIYASAIIFAYLVTGGRRFGRPLPLPGSTAHRAPVEHIRAMANLFRRGGKRAAILHHYHDRLKRELAHPYHLDPTLNDADFVAQLSLARPDLDSDALSRLLRDATRREAGQGQGRVSESELIRLAKEVDDWIRKN